MSQPGGSTSSRDTSWHERLAGLVPPEIMSRRVLIAGCGSVGSFVASELVRSGVRKLILVDPDIVEWANITRTVYGHADVGRPKVEALSSHLLQIFPDLEIETKQCTLQDLGEDLRKLLSDTDIVVGAVDDPKGTGRLNRYTFASNKPSVFVGLYRGAKGGEVILSIPDRTPCFHCSTGGVRQASEELSSEPVARERDYGSNRLVAEVALGSDIHFVCAAAVKLVLSTLALQHNPGPLADFVQKALDEGNNYAIFGMTSDYFLFPETHRGAVGQYAFQSLWLKTSSRPECTVCGDIENRELPV